MNTGWQEGAGWSAPCGAAHRGDAVRAPGEVLGASGKGEPPALLPRSPHHVRVDKYPDSCRALGQELREGRDEDE